MNLATSHCVDIVLLKRRAESKKVEESESRKKCEEEKRKKEFEAPTRLDRLFHRRHLRNQGRLAGSSAHITTY